MDDIWMGSILLFRDEWIIWEERGQGVKYYPHTTAGSSTRGRVFLKE
jgi:hypothetical protein